MKLRSHAPVAPADARYQIEHKLGEGAAGAVYLARDLETGELLALKKLFRMDAKSVLRLKREFRSLQALNHPHIVKLYDMGQGADAWFLTMEYLDGCDLTSYVGAAGEGALGPRLLPAFAQLARGIQALHDAGMLHRDLKPSNVMVERERVVVLDFGLVRELSRASASLTEDGSIAGTPAYMAPEQILAQPLTAACDWYTFGAMLYESISGLLPFDGPMMQILRDKLEREPIALSEVAPGAPAWLSELCMSLLKRNPAERPSGADVLAKLGELQPSAVRAASPANTDNVLPTEVEVDRTGELVGRSDELARLHRALAEAEDGRSVVVHVRAPSGTGKSALIERFLNEIERPNGDALVLRSRCYELEAMPFKALDGVIDALTRHLSQLEDLEVAHYLPVDIAALTQLFPVLERLRAVTRLMTMSKLALDAVQSRTRADLALHSLLDNLAQRAPLVIWIDDLQWGDLDSARILRHWLTKPSAAPILFLFSYRSDEVATSSCLQKLLVQEPGQLSTALAHTIDITPLGPEDMRGLCEKRLHPLTPGREAMIERLISEAQGNPFLASQLLALAEAKRLRGDTDLHALSLDLMVAQTSALLSQDAKTLLAFLAVAGRPMSPKLLLRAAAVKSGGRALVHSLRGLNLVRTREIAGQRALEVAHDRVRERVQRGLTPDQDRTIQQQLFQVLEASGEAEPDWLHTLALGSGQTAQALHYGLAAAARASASLAFERAAGLYRACVTLAPAEAAGEVWSKLAAALARSGWGVQAAEASLEAAKHVPAQESATWIERAAAHYLRCGHFAQGEELVRRALQAKGISVPSSGPGLIAAIAWERARIKLYGTQDKVRVGEPAAELLQDYDLLSSLAISTQAYDPVRAAYFQARALRCALHAGEPRRMAAALARTGGLAALSGPRGAHDASALLARAEAMQAKLSAPDRKPLLIARALVALGSARLDEVFEPAQEAERLLRADAQDDPTGNYHSRMSVVAARFGALLLFGRFSELAAQLQSVLAEAIAHDNRLSLLQLTYVQTRMEQEQGDGSASRARLLAQQLELPEGGFGILHVLHMSALMCCAYWTEDFSFARTEIEATWSRFLRSPLRHTALTGFAHIEHARYLLNRYVVGGHAAGSLGAIATDLRALAKHSPTGDSFLHARLAWLKGDKQEAIRHLRQNIEALKSLQNEHWSAVDHFALGLALGGNEGSELRAQAEQRLRALGAIDPLKDLRAYYPELMELL